MQCAESRSVDDRRPVCRWSVNPDRYPPSTAKTAVMRGGCPLDIPHGGEPCGGTGGRGGPLALRQPCY